MSTLSVRFLRADPLCPLYPWCPWRHSLLIQLQPLHGNLQAVDVAEYRRRDGTVLKQFHRNTLDILGRDAIDALKGFVETELPVEIDFLPRDVRHPAGGVLEAEHQAALQVIFGPLQFGRRHRGVLHAP